jgi:hypothetical protein
MGISLLLAIPAVVLVVVVAVTIVVVLSFAKPKK